MPQKRKVLICEHAFLRYNDPKNSQSNHHRQVSRSKRGVNICNWLYSMPDFGAISPVINGRRALPPAPLYRRLDDEEQRVQCDLVR